MLFLFKNGQFLIREKRDAVVNVTALRELPSTELCGRETRQSACRLLEGHNLGYVWLWPVALGPIQRPDQTPLQMATSTASALENVKELCRGGKRKKSSLVLFGYIFAFLNRTAPFNGLKFCVCSTVLETLYTYAAELIYFSLPVMFSSVPSFIPNMSIFLKIGLFLDCFRRSLVFSAIFTKPFVNWPSIATSVPTTNNSSSNSIVVD